MARFGDRPPTPDLNDTSIPCVNSVKHLIAECCEYETGSQALNPHLIEVLTQNPTDDLELLDRSLENFQKQEGIPEYDDILSVQGGLDDFLETPKNEATTNAGVYDDSFSLGSASISQFSHASASVTLNGKTYYSTVPEPPQMLTSDLSFTTLKYRSKSMDSSLGGASLAPSVGSHASFTSTKSAKPRNFAKSVRKRGPFSMVGPDIPIHAGILPVQTKEIRDEALTMIRSRKREGGKNYSTIR